MNFVISGKNLEVSDGLREAIQEKLGKLERYFAPDTIVNVTLSVEKERQKIEVTIPVKRGIIRAEQVSSDMYYSLDMVEEIKGYYAAFYDTELTDGQAQAILDRAGVPQAQAAAA